MSKSFNAWLTIFSSVLLLLALPAAIPPALAAGGNSVLTYHGSPERSGNFVVPDLTWQRARSIRLDPSFHPRFSGHLYAQPLYWQPPGAVSGELIVATENDTVLAIDAQTGSTVWSRALGRPVPLATQPCGNIDPLGITGTPIIDDDRRRSFSTRWSPRRRGRVT